MILHLMTYELISQRTTMNLLSPWSYQYQFRRG